VRLPANVYDTTCESRRVLDSVMNKWALLILLLLATGVMRYNEFRREIKDISHKMLTQTLRSLEAEGFVLRTVYPVIPPHVEYALTPAGDRLIISMRELVSVVEDHVNRQHREADSTTGTSNGL